MCNNGNSFTFLWERMSEEFQQQNVARKKCMCNQTLFVPSLFLHYSNLNRIPEVIAYMCTQHLHAHSQHSLVLPSGNMEMGKTAAWNEHVGHATISFLTAVKAVCRCTPRGVVGVRICIIVSITSRRVTLICQMLVIAEKKNRQASAGRNGNIFRLLWHS